MKWWTKVLARLRWRPSETTQESAPPARGRMPELHDLKNEALKELLTTEVLSRRHARLKAQADLFRRRKEAHDK